MLIELAYKQPPDSLQLAAAEVHIWHLQLTQPAETEQALFATLGSDERARAERFHFDRDRSAYTVAHGALRCILANYVSETPERLTFENGSQGKPRLAGFTGTVGLHFNLSHSAGLGLLAVSKAAELGIDLERVRPIAYQEQIAARFFSPAEQAELAQASPEQRPWAFFKIWTRKEALAKADGGGLSLAPEQLDSSTRLAGSPARDGGPTWSAFQFCPALSFIAALVVAGPVDIIRPWQWVAR